MLLASFVSFCLLTNGCFDAGLVVELFAPLLGILTPREHFFCKSRDVSGTYGLISFPYN